MNELEVPQFSLEFYGPGCLPIREGTPEYETALRGTRRYLNRYYREEIAALEELEVEKPKWFQEAEADARLFMSTLAFDDLAPMVVFARDTENRIFGSDAPASTIAIHEPHAIMVKREAINSIRHRYGKLGVGNILVHELAHATASPTRMGVHIAKRHKREFVYGMGMMTGGEDHPKGEFWEEGFAEYIAGYYVRCRLNDSRPTPLISFKGLAPKTLPAHYAFPISTETASGPDGYAIELLAGDMQKRHERGEKGAMSVGSFISLLLEARRPETAVAARRELIRTMEKSHPGLYALLRDMPYSRENWQKACNLVHTLVTQE